MENKNYSMAKRKKTICGIALIMTGIVVGLYCFREQLQLYALNSTSDTLIQKHNTITEENVEFYLYPLTKDLSLKWKNEHGMEFRNIGTGGSDGLNLVGLSYNIDAPLNVSDARILLVECVSELLDKMNEHEKLHPQLQVYPFTPKNLRFAISFGKDNEYPAKGELAWIDEYEGTINYYTHNPDAGKYGRYEILFAETYEEALNIIAQSPAPSTAASDSSLTANAD